MKVETFEDLFEWTRQLHQHLAERLQQSSSQHSDTRASLLLSYLGDQEAALEKTVANFARRADPKMLHTWLYDYFAQWPVEANATSNKPWQEMDISEIGEQVFALHHRIIELYKYLEGRADTPEARELLQELREMEEHETMRLVHQANRMGDL